MKLGFFNTELELFNPIHHDDCRIWENRMARPSEFVNKLLRSIRILGLLDILGQVTSLHTYSDLIIRDYA